MSDIQIIQPQPQVVIQNNIHSGVASSDKSRLLMFIICFLFGFLGVHRFMTGHLISGLLYLLTLGFGGIGVIIDLLYILTGGFKEKNGAVINK